MCIYIYCIPSCRAVCHAMYYELKQFKSDEEFRLSVALNECPWTVATLDAAE